MSAPANRDYHDMLAALVAEDVRFLIVGAHALAVHGVPRATVDIDIWIDRSPQNANRVWKALAAFGAPVEALDVREQDLTRPDVVAQFGVAPNRIDFLTGVTGVTFDEAWPNRIEALLEGVMVPVLSRDDLIRNKTATGRDKDRGDVRALRGKS